MINTEQLAEELHKFYRATFKALATSLLPIRGHDHGWSHCNKKKYFLRRAEQLARTLTYRNMSAQEIEDLNTKVKQQVEDFQRIHDDRPFLSTEGLGHVGHD